MNYGGTSPATLQNYVLQAARSRVATLAGARHVSARSREESALDLIALLNSITLAVKKVGKRVRSVGLPRPRSELDSLNSYANQCWIDELLYSQKSCVIVSEDLSEPVIVQEEMQGKFAVVFDPLTGLSDPPAPDLGAIFGVFYQVSGGATPGVADVLQPAKNLIAAGYTVYSSCTTLMFSIGDGLHQFTLDSSMNEFILTGRDIKIPFHGTTYSINEGYTSEYDEQTRQMLRVLKTEPALNGAQRSARYIGSMVADIHRTILKGGIYLYPATKQRPQGKLKLLYEAGPMAWLVTQAGGHASTGKMPITEIRPANVHTTVPAFLGSEDEVSLATGMYIPTPWGTGNLSDPMYALRRKNSISEKSKKAKQGIPIGNDADDGIICCHLGIPGA